MIDQALLTLLESVLGKGKPTSRGNYAFNCPNGCHSHKPKLEICLNPEEFNIKGESVFQNYSCWVCGGQKDGFKGKKIKNLLKKINSPSRKIEELNLIVGNTDIKSSDFKPKPKTTPSLPKEFIKLDNPNLNVEGKNALKYLIKKRNLTFYDIQKYNIGYCEEGKYAQRVIIPSYNSKGDLNYFISRTYLEGERLRKYDIPPFSRDIIFFELFINWNLPLILCEGVFDAITLKRNSIPLLGTNISHSLMKKIVESKVKKVYLVLDTDAIKKSIEHCELLINEGKKVYFVTLPNKDPNKVGFNNMLDILFNSKPLTLSRLLEIKLNF